MICYLLFYHSTSKEVFCWYLYEHMIIATGFIVSKLLLFSYFYTRFISGHSYMKSVARRPCTSPQRQAKYVFFFTWHYFQSAKRAIIIRSIDLTAVPVRFVTVFTRHVHESLIN